MNNSNDESKIVSMDLITIARDGCDNNNHIAESSAVTREDADDDMHVSISRENSGDINMGCRAKRYKDLLFGVPRDCWLLCSARSLRLMAYGWLGVALYEYLSVIGLQATEIGVLFTMILVGDIVVSLILTTQADRLGRKGTLIVGAILMVTAGIAFALSSNVYVLAVFGTLAVISPSGNETGPFLAVEQAALTQVIKSKDTVTQVFSVYAFIGYLAMAFGGLVGGFVIGALLDAGASAIDAYRSAVIAYSVFAVGMLVLYGFLSKKIEAPGTKSTGCPPSRSLSAASSSAGGGVRAIVSRNGGIVSLLSGLKSRQSQVVVMKISLLFLLDTFGGGFVMQSAIVYWLIGRWSVDVSVAGTAMMCANVAAACSALLAGPLANRVGLINTIILTHLPSNILLLLVPFMPSGLWAMCLIILRFSISRMDVPTRQAFVVLVVSDDERSAASGVTNVFRSIGLSIAPLIVGVLVAHPADTEPYVFGASFFIAGSVGIVYDILLWLAMRRVQVPDHKPSSSIAPSSDDSTELGIPSVVTSRK
jgi:MFS family permease